MVEKSGYEKSPTGMLKHSGGKLRVELVPVQWIKWLSAGMSYGAYEKKPQPYGPMNWAKGGKASSLTTAALRHLSSYIDGEELDQDSGHHHLIHCAMNCLMLVSLSALGRLENDLQFYNPKKEGGK